MLQSWGNTAIFGGYENPDFVAAAQTAGLKVYAEFGCFVHKRWWDKVPESRPVTDEGIPLEPEEWYYGVNPSIPIVRTRLLVRQHLTVSKPSEPPVWNMIEMELKKLFDIGDEKLTDEQLLWLKYGGSGEK